MKSDVSHLPNIKQAELRKITEIICEKAKVYMVILFGSYARGDYVEDLYIEDHITYEYQSDYDILVVLKEGNTREQRVDEVLNRDIRNEPTVNTPVSLIFHSIDFIKRKLASSEYFFTDIKREGILLYNSKEVTLGKYKKLSIGNRLQLAKEDYEHWFTKAQNFYDIFLFTIEKEKLEEGAFLLHQATEALYSVILLVYTHYKPKLHDLEKLANQAASLSPVFLHAIPNTTPEEQHHFKLLKKAYIDARYKKNYSISKDELLYMGEKVKAFMALTEKMALEKIAEFEALRDEARLS